MAQTTQLAAATSAGTSSSIAVAAGAEAVIGLFVASGTLQAAGDQFRATVQQATPGAVNSIATLSAENPSCIVRGPNTFTVTKAVSLVAVGVFSE
jgi:hypothetical protein